jgi:hypothetical protein
MHGGKPAPGKLDEAYQRQWKALQLPEYVPLQ